MGHHRSAAGTDSLSLEIWLLTRVNTQKYFFLHILERRAAPPLNPCHLVKLEAVMQMASSSCRTNRIWMSVTHSAIHFIPIIIWDSDQRRKKEVWIACTCM